MKGLATALLFVGLIHPIVIAGSLEMSFGGGPSAVSLDAISDFIELSNAWITELNETFSVRPDVTGTVDLVPPIGGMLALHGAERYWLNDWFALGGHIGYSRTSTATAGFYEGTEVSEIAVDLAFHSVGCVLGGEARFLNVGLRLSAFGGVGYYYVIVDRKTVFEIPSEYQGIPVGVPPEGEGRYTGGTIGFEGGVSLTYPVAPWFLIGSRMAYRSARVSELTDATANVLDLDGDDVGESISLSGLTVQLAVSINIDLSLDGRKE
jgi:hypothetical protein